VMGISLVLTFFVMAPVAADMVRAAATAPEPGDPGGAGPPAGGGTPAGAGATGAGAPAGADAPAGPGGAGAPVNPYAEGAAGAPVDPYRAAPGQPGEAAGGAGAGPPPARLDVEGALRQLVPARHREQVDAASRAVEPLRAFLERHAAERDRETFAGVARGMGRDVTGREAWVLAPAFLTTELREAFAIAVLIVLPFLVIDPVVALALAALGLQATQPQIVALPLKLLLFVTVDGWRLLIDGLLRGYA
jgi:type III secretory pathway component EscR